MQSISSWTDNNTNPVVDAKLSSNRTTRRQTNSCRGLVTRGLVNSLKCLI